MVEDVDGNDVLELYTFVDEEVDGSDAVFTGVFKLFTGLFVEEEVDGSESEDFVFFGDVISLSSAFLLDFITL